MACVLCPTTFPAAPDMITCWRCRDRLRRRIDPDHSGAPDDDTDPASIPRLYALLTPAKTGQGDGGRGAPGIHAAVPIDVHAVSMLDGRSKAIGQAWADRGGIWSWEPGAGDALLHAPTVLQGWADEVARLADVEAPDHPARRPRDDDYIGPLTRRQHMLQVRPRLPRPVDSARFLLQWLDWACGQDLVVAMADELAVVHNQLRGATRRATGEHRPQWIGFCAEPAPDTKPAYERPRDADYIGPMTELEAWRADPDLDRLQGRPRCDHPLFAPRTGDTITCNGCGAYWERRDWLVLGGILEQAAAS